VQTSISEIDIFVPNNSSVISQPLFVSRIPFHAILSCPSNRNMIFLEAVNLRFCFRKWNDDIAKLWLNEIASFH